MTSPFTLAFAATLSLALHAGERETKAGTQLYLVGYRRPKTGDPQ